MFLSEYYPPDSDGVTRVTFRLYADRRMLVPARDLEYRFVFEDGLAKPLSLVTVKDYGYEVGFHPGT